MFDFIDDAITVYDENMNAGYRCYPTPSDRSAIASRLDAIANDIIKLKRLSASDDSGIPPIAGIGIVVSGYVESKISFPCTETTIRIINTHMLISSPRYIWEWASAG